MIEIWKNKDQNKYVEHSNLPGEAAHGPLVGLNNYFRVFITLTLPRNSFIQQCQAVAFTDWTVNLSYSGQCTFKYAENIQMISGGCLTKSLPFPIQIRGGENRGAKGGASAPNNLSQPPPPPPPPTTSEHLLFSFFFQMLFISTNAVRTSHVLLVSKINY